MNGTMQFIVQSELKRGRDYALCSLSGQGGRLAPETAKCAVGANLG